MLSSDFKEDIEDGKAQLFVRNGIFQVRVYRGDRRYLYRTLKTSKIADARRLAIRCLHEIEFKQKEGLPLTQNTMAQLIPEVARKHKVSAQAIYTWRRRFGELQPADVRRLRHLEIENAKLKKLVAERDLEIDTMKEINRRKW